MARTASQFQGGLGSGAGRWPARLLSSKVGLEVVQAGGPHGFSVSRWAWKWSGQVARTASEFQGGLGSGAGRWPARLLSFKVGLEVVRAGGPHGFSVSRWAWKWCGQVARTASEFQGGLGSGAGRWPARLLSSKVGLEVVRAGGPHGF